MEHEEKKLSSKMIYQGRVVTLRTDMVELENGQITSREVIEHPGGVGIAALDRDGCLLMVRQFRYPTGTQLLEIPAGKLEYGEDPLAAGRRELEEETGHIAARWTSLGQLWPTPAYDMEMIHLFLAEDLTPTRQHLDPGEFLTVERIPLQRLVKLVLDGKVRDAKTQIAVLKLAMARRTR